MNVFQDIRFRALMKPTGLSISDWIGFWKCWSLRSKEIVVQYQDKIQTPRIKEKTNNKRNLRIASTAGEEPRLHSRIINETRRHCLQFMLLIVQTTINDS